MVGDTGFEPVTSTVCKRHKFWSHFGHSFEWTSIFFCDINRGSKKG
jgi:hypothetical protein